VTVHPGMQGCVLTFEEITDPVKILYDKKKTTEYKEQQRPIPSKITEERD